MTIPLGNGRELPLNPLLLFALLVHGVLTLLHRDWGKVWRAHG